MPRFQETKWFWFWLGIVTTLLCLSLTAHCEDEDSKDWQTENESLHIPCTLEIAHLYNLSRDQTALLLAIEEHEAGGPGKEFGVENIPCEWHEGHKSFLINCARACETIENCTPEKINHLTILKLGRRWAVDKSWHVYVYKNFKKYQKNILY